MSHLSIIDGTQKFLLSSGIGLAGVMIAWLAAIPYIGPRNTIMSGILLLGIDSLLMIIWAQYVVTKHREGSKPNVDRISHHP